MQLSSGAFLVHSITQYTAQNIQRIIRHTLFLFPQIRCQTSDEVKPVPHRAVNVGHKLQIAFAKKLSKCLEIFTELLQDLARVTWPWSCIAGILNMFRKILLYSPFSQNVTEFCEHLEPVSIQFP